MAALGKQAFEKDIYAVVKTAIGSTITGGCYLAETRPLNSGKEDAVVVVSTATGDQIQEGRAKVNIYVADLDSGSGTKVPNISRLRVIEALDSTILDALNSALDDYVFWLSGMTDTFAEAETKEHFININIGFKHKTF